MNEAFDAGKLADELRSLVRDAESLSEITDPGAAIASDGLQNERLAVSG